MTSSSLQPGVAIALRALKGQTLKKGIDDFDSDEKIRDSRHFYQ